MKKLIYLSTLLFLFVLPMMAQQPLFPTPAKVQNGKGSFVIGKNLQVQGNGGYADKLAAALPAELKEAGLQSSPASGTIRLELTNDCKMADEAYTLVVEPNSILLQASSEAGLFYAKEALLQLSRFGKGNVRACKIQDQPRYGWRGFMRREPPLLRQREGKTISGYHGVPSPERLPLAPDRRTGLAHRDQALSEADHRRGCRQLARPESARYVLHPGRDQGDRCLCSRSPHHGRSRIRHAGPCYCCLPFLS